VVQQQISNLRANIQILINSYDDLIVKSGGTVADIRLPIDLSESFQANLANYRRILSEHKISVNNELPDLIDELQNHGFILSDRERLSQGIMGTIDDSTADFDAAIPLYKQDSILKMKNSLNRANNCELIGKWATRISYVGDFLVGIGIMLQGYGVYLDNVSLIIIGKTLLWAGIVVELLAVGLSIVAGIMAHSVGLIIDFFARNSTRA